MSDGIPFGVTAGSMLDGLSPDLIARLLQAAQAPQPQQAPAAQSPVDALLFDRAGMGAPDNGFSGSSGTIAEPQSAAPPRGVLSGVLPGPQATGSIPQAAPAPAGGEPSQPAPGAAPASPAPTPPAAAPAPAGAGSPGILGALSNPRVYNTLLGVGAGILSGRTFGEGLGQGIENAQRMNAQQGASDLAQARAQMEQSKLQRELAGQNQTAKIIASKMGIPLEDATALAMNPQYVQSFLSSQFGAQDGRVRNADGSMSVVPGSAQDPAQIAAATGAAREPITEAAERAGAVTAATEAAKPRAPISVGEGTTLVDPKSLQPVFANPKSTDAKDDGAKITAQIEARRGQAASLGLVEGSPAWQSFVGTGKIGRDQEMSATDKKAINAAEDELPLLSQTISTLKRAKELNNQTFTGITAGVRGKIGTSVPGASMFLDPKASEATREFGQLMSMEAIKAMSSTLKGATTDTEMGRFMDILGDPATPPDIRARTLDRMHTLALRQEQIAKARVNDLRGATYYKKGGGAPDQTDDEGGASAPVTGAKRMRFDPTTGGFN